VWVDRNGNAEVIPDLAEQAAQAGVAFIAGPRVSPDGTTISFWAPGGGDDAGDENAATLWFWDTERGRLTRPVPGESHLYWTVWGPRGDRIYSSGFVPSMAQSAIYETTLESGEGPRLLPQQLVTQWSMPYSITADGTHILYHAGDAAMRDLDVWMLSLADGGRDRPIVDAQGIQHHPAVSPDGRHLAYVSNESGRREVYLTDLPDATGARQVSGDGGWAPAWSRDGRHVVFLREVGNLVAAMEVGWAAEPGGAIAEVRELFRGPYRSAMTWGAQYDFAPDGQRFLMIRQPQGGAALSQLTVVLNWFEELQTISER